VGQPDRSLIRQRAFGDRIELPLLGVAMVGVICLYRVICEQIDVRPSPALSDPAIGVITTSAFCDVERRPAASLWRLIPTLSRRRLPDF
jgi:hypothetical protein